MKFQDIKHFFTATPDLLQVKGFADGVEGELKLSWQHPIPNPDPDSDEPAEGTNHLRIEVNTEWLPFDPDKVKPIKDYCLLLTSFDEIRSFTAQEVEVVISDHEVIDKLLWLDQGENALSDMPFFYESEGMIEGVAYKLVPLPQ